MSEKHFGNVQPSIDNEEHEHNVEPATKRVMPYGWDGTAKRTLSTDSSGRLNTSVISGNAPLVLGYSGSNLVTITKTIGTEEHIKTLTYDENNVLTDVSAWSPVI